MKLDYKLTNSGTDELRTNIIRQTAKQHRFLLRKRGRIVVKDHFLDDEIKDVELFLLSAWGQLLSGGNGEYIIEKDYEVVKEELAKERRKIK